MLVPVRASPVPSVKKERKKTDNPNEGWGRRTGSTPARAGFWKDDQGDTCQKERKKTNNPREGWENGTPPPHRDFKERSVMR